MARIKIVQDDIIMALESHSNDSSWALDLKTGEIIFLPSDLDFIGGEDLKKIAKQIEAGSNRYLSIDPLPSYIGINIMAEFAESVTDLRMQESLFRALSGCHPFRKFKDALCEDEDVRQQYFASRDQQMVFYALRWLGDKEVDAELIPSAQ